MTTEEGNTETICRRYKTFHLNGYRWKIEYTDDSEYCDSAQFDVVNKCLLMNNGYIRSYAQYEETLRHEIFEACCTIMATRYISLDMNDNSVIVMRHNQIDVLLGMYHGALSSLE